MNAVTHLPDEILEAILQHFPMAQMSLSERLPYLLVCKKWTAIFESVIFESVQLFYTGNESPRISQFLNLLINRPSLRRCIHTVYIASKYIDQWIYDQIMRVFNLCISIRHFTYGTWEVDPELPELYHKAIREKHKSMLMKAATLDLRSICLRVMPWPLIVEAIKDAKVPCVKIIDTKPHDLPQPSTVLVESSALSPNKDEPRKLQNEYVRCGQAKELHICDALSEARDLWTILTWPDKLESLYLKQIFFTEMPSQADLDDLLQHHTQTLKTLYIGTFSTYTFQKILTSPINYRFDASRCTSLKKLSVSVQNLIDIYTIGDPIPRRLYRYFTFHLVIGPVLELLEIRLTDGIDEYIPNYTALMTHLILFMRGLKTYLEDKPISSIQVHHLRQIRILEVMRDGPRNTRGTGNDPTEFLSEAQKVMAEVSVEVVYKYATAKDYTII